MKQFFGIVQKENNFFFVRKGTVFRSFYRIWKNNSFMSLIFYIEESFSSLLLFFFGERQKLSHIVFFVVKEEKD